MGRRFIVGFGVVRFANVGYVSRFHDLAWTEGDDDSRGVVAGALENGSLDLWDADKLLNGERCGGPRCVGCERHLH